MTASARLSVSCDQETTASKLARVLSPDNRTVPADQRFSMTRSGRVLEFDVSSKRSASVLTTLVGVLEDISLVNKVWLLSRSSHA